MCILIAEDEVTIARALKVMLEKDKYTVDLATTETTRWIISGPPPTTRWCWIS